jgi:hypothetical protein
MVGIAKAQVQVFYVEASPPPKCRVCLFAKSFASTAPGPGGCNPRGRAPGKAATRIKKPTDTRMPSGQTENLITEHLNARKLSKLAADVDELSRICKLAR